MALEVASIKLMYTGTAFYVTVTVNAQGGHDAGLAASSKSMRSRTESEGRDADLAASLEDDLDAALTWLATALYGAWHPKLF